MTKKNLKSKLKTFVAVKPYLHCIKNDLRNNSCSTYAYVTKMCVTLSTRLFFTDTSKLRIISKDRISQ